MKTNAIYIGMLVSALAIACSDNDSDTLDESPGAAGDSNADASGGKSGEDEKATGGKSSDNQKATGGKSATGGTFGDDDDDEAGGSPGAAGDSGTGGNDEPEPGAAGAGGSLDSGEAGAGPHGSAGQTGGDSESTFGFAIRAPQEREVTCSENMSGMTDPGLLMDEDYVCTFVDGSVEGHLYVQATPTDCQMLMGATPTTFTASGWISVGGEVAEIEGLVYDHGGNHFNNTFEFDYGDQHYRFAHSSIGFGGRSCQPPDCLQMFEEDGATIVEDGCTLERTLPVTCAAVEAEGVVPALDIPFEPCPGDPNYEEETDSPLRG